MDVKVIENVAKMQDALNEFITKDWKKNRTALDFQIASHQEVAELIDTEYVIDEKKENIKWKWWKGAAGERTTDSLDWENTHPKVLDNIKIELVDLLFFSLSGIKVVKQDYSSKAEIISENDWQNFMDISKYNLLERPTDAVSIIIQLAEKIDFNIIAYYCAKHQLNYFRQLDGYKDGSYKKVQNGMEDNELLHEMIMDIKISDFEENFADTYDKISKRFYEVFKVEVKDQKFFLNWIELIK